MTTSVRIALELGVLFNFMDNGWIKIHRKIQDWEWYQDSNMVHLFLHFLLLANHEKGKWQGQIIETGQFITGRLKLSEDTGISQQTIRTCITKLKSTNEIAVKSTNKFSIITLIKWSDYQTKPDTLTTKSTNKLTNDQPTTNQQLTTNKKNKELKNNKEDLETAHAVSDINPIISIFEKSINPTINYGNITQRKAVETLISKVGVEKTINAAKYAISIQVEKYAPVITTPTQLLNKYGELQGYYARQKKSTIKQGKTLIL